jgi:hypothetical protein
VNIDGRKGGGRGFITWYSLIYLDFGGPALVIDEWRREGGGVGESSPRAVIVLGWAGFAPTLRDEEPW